MKSKTSAISYMSLSERSWGVRFEYLTIGTLFCVAVSKHFAFRLVVFGLSFHVGRIPKLMHEFEWNDATDTKVGTDKSGS